MTSHVLDNLKFFIVVGIVIVAILLVGWRQPLSYRFMSRAEIDALENPATPPVVSATPWMWDKSRSGTLDRPAYSRDTDYARRYYQTGR